MADYTQNNLTLAEAYGRAKAALEGGTPERAIAITQHILRYYPRYLDAYRLLGEAYLERGHIDEAHRLFTHVLQGDPQNVLAHIGRGIIADERGDPDTAIDEYERAFEIDPSIPELRSELLRLYAGRYGSAGATIRTTPSGLAYVHLRAGLRDAAISELSYVAQLRPDRWDIEVALAEALWRNEQFDEVTAISQDLLASHPSCVKCNWMLGYLHWTAGRTESGRQYLLAAVALDPTYTVAERLWDATPWPLDPHLTRRPPAQIPAWASAEIEPSDLDLGRVLRTQALVLEPEPPPSTRRITQKFEAMPPLPEAPPAEPAPVPVVTAPSPLDLDWFDEWASVAETPTPPPFVPPSAAPAEPADEPAAEAPAPAAATLDAAPAEAATPVPAFPEAPLAEAPAAADAAPEAPLAEAPAAAVEAMDADTFVLWRGSEAAEIPETPSAEAETTAADGALPAESDASAPEPAAESAPLAAESAPAPDGAPPTEVEAASPIEAEAAATGRPVEAAAAAAEPGAEAEPAPAVATALAGDEGPPAEIEAAGPPAAPESAPAELAAAPAGEQEPAESEPLPVDLDDDSFLTWLAEMTPDAELSASETPAPAAEPGEAGQLVAEEGPSAAPILEEAPLETAAGAEESPELAVAEAQPLDGAAEMPPADEAAEFAQPPGEEAPAGETPELAQPEGEAAPLDAAAEAPPADETLEGAPPEAEAAPPADVSELSEPVGEAAPLLDAAAETLPADAEATEEAAPEAAPPAAAPAPDLGEWPAWLVEGTAVAAPDLSAPAAGETAPAAPQDAEEAPATWLVEGTEVVAPDLTTAPASGEPPGAEGAEADSAPAAWLTGAAVAPPPPAAPEPGLEPPTVAADSAAGPPVAVPSAPDALADENFFEWIGRTTPGPDGDDVPPAVPATPAADAALHDGPGAATRPVPAPAPQAAPTPPPAEPEDHELRDWLGRTAPYSDQDEPDTAPSDAAMEPPDNSSEVGYNHSESGARDAGEGAVATDAPTEEAEMSPSYKEDDEQERQFDFDWDHEALPDYLKPFLMDETTGAEAAPAAPSSAAPAPPAAPVAPVAAQPPAPPPPLGVPDMSVTPSDELDLSDVQPFDFGALSGGGADFDFGSNALPDWLNSSAAATAGQHSAEPSGLPDWLNSSPAPPPAAPPPPARTAEPPGLPDWLSSGPTPPPAAPPPPARAAEPPGLPDWLMPPPAAPAPAPQAGPATRPLEIPPLAGPPPTPPAADFDFNSEALPSWLAGGAAPQPPPPPTAPTAGSPGFRFEAAPPAGEFDFSDLQPFDYNALAGSPAGSAPPAPAPAGDEFDFGGLQPFDFGNMGGPAPGEMQPEGSSDVDDFIDFLSVSASEVPAVPPASAAPAPPPAAPPVAAAGRAPAPPPPPAGPDDFDFELPPGLQPFSFEDLDVAGPAMAAPAPSRPPAAAPPPSSFVPSGPAPMPAEPSLSDVGNLSGEEFNFEPFVFDQGGTGAGFPATPTPSPFGAPPSSGLDVAASGAGMGTGGMPPGLEDLPDLQPFSFEGLEIGGGRDLGFTGAGQGSDYSLRGPEREGSRAPLPFSFDEESAGDVDDVHNFSWQRPGAAARPTPAPAEVPETSNSIFAKARKRKEELEQALRREAEAQGVAALPPEAAPAPLEPAEAQELDYWPSLDEEELPEVPAAPAAQAPPMAEDFGLDLAPFTFDEAGILETPAPTAPAEPSAGWAVPAEPAASMVPMEPEASAPAAEPEMSMAPPVEVPETPAAATAPVEMAPEVPAAEEGVPAAEGLGEEVAAGEYDFSGLQPFDLSALELTPEERAYLLGETAAAEAPSEAAVAAPTEPELPAYGAELPPTEAPAMEAAAAPEADLGIPELQTLDQDVLPSMPTQDIQPFTFDVAAFNFDEEPQAGAAETAPMESAFPAFEEAAVAEPFAAAVPAEPVTAAEPSAEAAAAEPSAEAAPVEVSPAPEAPAAEPSWIAAPAAEPAAAPPAEVSPVAAESWSEMTGEGIFDFGDWAAEVAPPTPAAEAAAAPPEAPAPAAETAPEPAGAEAAPTTRAPAYPEPWEDREAAPAVVEPAVEVPAAPVAEAAAVAVSDQPAAPAEAPEPAAPPAEVPAAPAAPAEAPVAAEAPAPVTVPAAPAAAPSPAPAAPASPVGDSIGDLVRYLDNTPNDTAARLALAIGYEQRDDYARAAEQYKQLIKSRDVPANMLEIVVGNLRELVESQPDNGALHRLLGDAYMKQGQFQMAIGQYNWLLTKGGR